MPRARNALFILAIAAPAGCVHWPDRSADPLGRQSPTPANAALLAKINEHLQKQEFASAQVLIERRLPAAIGHLRTIKKASTVADLAIARIADLRLEHPADDGWTARLTGNARGGVARAEALLQKARGLAQAQQWPALCDLLGPERPALAKYPLHAVHADLLLAEAERQRGELRVAGRTWQEAVAKAAKPAPAWLDPDLWQSLQGQRTPLTPWPPEVNWAFAALLPEDLRTLPANPAFPAESLVWHAIGHAHLEASNAQAALAAFEHADSRGQFADWDDFISLCRARALLDLGRTDDAAKVLAGLTARPADAAIRRPALALVGIQKLRTGQMAEGIAPLREVLESSDADFPGRAAAEAELGLALLASDASAAQRWLQGARTRFGNAHDFASLRRCLESEARHHAQSGHPDAARALSQQIRELELASILRGLPAR